jgi:hypothetical protein
MTKASGVLEIVIDISRDKAEEIRLMIKDAGVSSFISMVISGHLLYCFMLFYFLFYTDDDLRTFTQHRTVK